MSKKPGMLAVLLPLSLMISPCASAQEPLTLSPSIGGNTNLTNGATPGYSPTFTAGGGLTLNLSPGAVYCSTNGMVVTYPGGTLAVGNGTNFVYLDPTASCAPASSTYPFSTGQIPIAIVIAAGGQITGVLPSGTTKQDAGITAIGTGPGLLIDVPGMGPGLFSSLPNNVPVLDFRQTQDIIPGEPSSYSVNPMRPPVMLMEQRLADFTTVNLTGTVTFNGGGMPSTAVTGVGTHFKTELHVDGSTPPYYINPIIRLAGDASTCWASVYSVASETSLTLTGSYPCSSTGGSGVAIRGVGQQGFGINAIISGGTPNTQAAGEYVALPVTIQRTSASSRGIYGANLNLTYASSAGPTQGQAYGLEIDLTNASGADDSAPDNSIGMYVASGGGLMSHRPGTGIKVTSSNPGNNAWQRGIYNASYSSVGYLGQGNGTAVDIEIIPGANDANYAFDLKNAGGSADVGYITHLGTTFMPSFEGAISPAHQSPGAQFHAYSAAASIQLPMRIENDTGSAGTASLGLGVASSGLGEASSFKGGLGLTRAGFNGTGNTCLYNRVTNDTSNFAAGDAFLCSNLIAGPAQNIAMTPSSGGKVSIAGALLVTGTVGQTLANGNAEIFASTGGGGLFGGQGSTNDLELVNKSVAPICVTPTGTTTLNCNAGSFTILSLASLQVNSVLVDSSTAPTRSSGFASSGTTITGSTTAAFSITIGTTPSSSGVLTFPAAAHGWAVHCDDVTTQTTSVFVTKQTGVSTTSVTLTQYNDVASATAWVTGDVLVCEARGF